MVARQLISSPAAHAARQILANRAASGDGWRQQDRRRRRLASASTSGTRRTCRSPAPAAIPAGITATPEACAHQRQYRRSCGRSLAPSAAQSSRARHRSVTRRASPLRPDAIADKGFAARSASAAAPASSKFDRQRHQQPLVRVTRQTRQPDRAAAPAAVPIPHIVARPAATSAHLGFRRHPIQIHLRCCGTSRWKALFRALPAAACFQQRSSNAAGAARLPRPRASSGVVRRAGWPAPHPSPPPAPEQLAFRA